MIVDAVVDFLVGIVEFVAGLLPEHEITPPPTGGLVSRLAQVDSLVPIAGPIQVAVVVASAVVVFVAVRLVLMARHVLLP